MKKVHLTYFKPSGKYYSDGDYVSSLNFDYDLYKEVRNMDSHPGLINRWDNGFILVQPEDRVPAVLAMTPRPRPCSNGFLDGEKEDEN